MSPGDVVRVPTLADKSEGDKIEFDEVLVSGDSNGVRIGVPAIVGARVTATVVRNGRGEDIVFKFNAANTTNVQKGIARVSPR